jgi:hypothetical protein
VKGEYTSPPRVANVLRSPLDLSRRGKREEKENEERKRKQR